jgi:thiol-disulfide isomerase/thioredoxin
MNGLAKFDTFLRQPTQLTGSKLLVTIAYQAFCDPCKSTKPYVEELAKKYGFDLVRIDLAGQYPPERAGENIPQLSVYHNGVCNTSSLIGAQTMKNIIAFLKERGAIPPDA